MDEAQFEAFNAASETCDPILEEAFGDFTLSPEQEAAAADLEARFNQCLADRGFDISGELTVDEDVDLGALDEAFDECGTIFDEPIGDSIEGGDDQ